MQMKSDVTYKESGRVEEPFADTMISDRMPRVKFFSFLGARPVHADLFSNKGHNFLVGKQKKRQV